MWNRMTTMTGPDCVVMRILINTHTPMHTHTRALGSHDAAELIAGIIRCDNLY